MKSVIYRIVKMLKLGRFIYVVGILLIVCCLTGAIDLGSQTATVGLLICGFFVAFKIIMTVIGFVFFYIIIPILRKLIPLALGVSLLACTIDMIFHKGAGLKIPTSWLIACWIVFIVMFRGRKHEN